MKKTLGFTLIELMIVVAVIAILAAIAMPSYQAHKQKTYRSAVQQFMMETANRQELYLLDARSYTNDFADLNLTIPGEVALHYTVVRAGAPNAYTITATPQGVMTGTNAQILDNLGTKTPADEWR